MYVKDAIGCDYIDWKRGDCIFIEAPTGSGKTTFILDTLLPYSKKRGKEILYLSNRFLLKEQIKVELAKRQNLSEDREWLEGVEEFDGITVLSYQKLQKLCAENTDGKYLSGRYAYIVCDEIHYLLEDSAFNPETLRTLEFLKKEKEILISISATMAGVDDILLKEKYGDLMLWNSRRQCSPYLKVVEVKGYLSSIAGVYRQIYFYKLPEIATMDQIFYFQNYATVIDVIRKSDLNEKWLIFQSNKKRAYELRKNIGEDAYLISADNKDDEILAELVRAERFHCRVLVSTKLLDNGINIKDLHLKHVLIDTISKTEFLQMLGRKRRVNADDQFTLYLPQKSIRIFQGYLTPEMQEIYKLLTIEIQTGEICRRVIKERKFCDLISRFFIWEGGLFIKNPLAVKYYEKQKEFVERMQIEMKEDQWAFIKEQLSWLGREKEFNSENLLEHHVQCDILEQIYKILNQLKGINLSRAEQEKLRLKLSKLLSTGGILPNQSARLVGKRKINELCLQYKIPFIIEAISGKHKGEETVWIVKESENICSG